MLLKNSDDASALVLAADRSMAVGDAAAAARLLARAAERRPSVEILLRLASARRVVGELNGALRAADQAVKLEPKNFLALLTLATLREAVDAEHRATRTYREALRYAPPEHLLPPAVQRQLEWAKQRIAADDEWIERLNDWSIAA